LRMLCSFGAGESGIQSFLTTLFVLTVGLLTSTNGQEEESSHLKDLTTIGPKKTGQV